MDIDKAFNSLDHGFGNIIDRFKILLTNLEPSITMPYFTSKKGCKTRQPNSPNFGNDKKQTKYKKS